MEKDRIHPHLDVLRGVPKGDSMNIRPKDLNRDLTHEDAAEALALLRNWAGQVTDEEVAALDPLVSRLVPGR